MPRAINPRHAFGGLSILAEGQRPVVQRYAATDPPAAWTAAQSEQANESSPQAGELGGGPVPDLDDAVAGIEQGQGPPGVAQDASDEERPVVVQASARRDAPTHRGFATSLPRAIVAPSSGETLPRPLRTEFERSFGADLGGVRIHSGAAADAAATALGADAFTVSESMWFARGKLDPNTRNGRWLLAHELTHVMQQRRGLSEDIRRAGIGRDGDGSELEADDVATRVVRGERVGDHNWTQGRRGPSDFAVQFYSGSRAAAYATLWAKGTNPLYGRMANDCTNFVSQAVHEGGLKMVFGKDICDNRKDNSVWWFLRDGCVRFILSNIHASHTWGGAHNFYHYLKTSGHGSALPRLSDLDVGDVAQMDFDGGGHIGHTMVVTKKSATNIYLSYHTSDHLNEPIWKDGSTPGILARNPAPPTRYYAWRIS